MSHTARVPLAEVLLPAAGHRLARAIVLAVIGALLLTLSAKIKLPIGPVPMTMQTYVVLVLAAAYGWRLGLATVVVYLAAGAAGLPVFTDTPARGVGLAYMIQHTGGYLVGFAAAAILVGWLAERGWDRSVVRLFLAMLAGHAVIFAFGWPWLAQFIGWEKAWALGVANFYVATLLKTALGAVTLPAVWSLLGRNA